MMLIDYLIKFRYIGTDDNDIMQFKTMANNKTYAIENLYEYLNSQNINHEWIEIVDISIVND